MELKNKRYKKPKIKTTSIKHLFRLSSGVVEQDWTAAESSSVLVNQLHVPFLPQSSAVPGDSGKPRAREAAVLGICNTGPSSCLQRKKTKLEQVVPLLSYCIRKRHHFLRHMV